MDQKAIGEATMKNIIEIESIIAEQVKVTNKLIVYFALMKNIVEKYNNVELTEDQEKQMLDNLSQTTKILSAFKKQN